MEQITVAAVSVRNQIGQADASTAQMRHWVGRAKEQSGDLVLFSELSLNGSR